MKVIASNGVEINTGDPVLVRDDNNENWKYAHFSHKENKSNYSYINSYSHSMQCIPYKGNEHLVGTNKDYRSYKEKQEQWIRENNIKIGDRVKIIKKSFNGNNGWNVYWAMFMNSAINKTGIITNIDNEGIEIDVTNIGVWWFPYHVLKKVEDKIEFRFGAKVKGVCEDNSIVEGILISYDKEDITLPYCIAIQKEKNYRIGIIEWVKSIEYIE